MFLYVAVWNTTAYAVLRTAHQSVSPEIWHQPDSLIVMPLKDSIAYTDEYTVFSVLQSQEPDSTECLWGFTENDTITHAVLTDGIYTPSLGVFHTRSRKDFANWSVYTYHSGIRMDSTQTHSFVIGEILLKRDNSPTDTLHAKIAMEELAYFKGRVSRHITGTFQTYLALKHGITLDYAAYLSQTGDTLWHPKEDEIYYNHVIGIGNDTVLGWESHVSCTKEEALLHIQTDTLMPSEYMIMGDDNGGMEWHPEPNGSYRMHRTWRLRQIIRDPKRITLSLLLFALEEKADSLQLIMTDTHGIETHLAPDSIIRDSVCYFTLENIDTLVHIHFQGVVHHPEQRINQNQCHLAINNASKQNITLDTHNNTIVVDGFPEDQVFVLYLYDNTGKFLSTLSSINPIDISMLPDAVFYVEVIADNQIVGAIPIPANVF